MAKHNTTQDLGLFVLRLALGLYLLLAGVGKVQGEISNGVGSFYNGPFKGLQPAWLPDLLAAPYGYALPWLEVLVGVLLVIGLLGRFAAVGGFLMLVSFTIVLAMANNSITAQGADAPGPYHANYIQSAAYFLIVLVGCGSWSVDTLLRKKRKGGG